MKELKILEILSREREREKEREREREKEKERKEYRPPTPSPPQFSIGIRITSEDKLKYCQSNLKLKVQIGRRKCTHLVTFQFSHYKRKAPLPY
jgi:hypothetical protein